MKLDIIMHYEVDETTGEVKYIGKDEMTVDTVKVTKPAAKRPSLPVIHSDGPTVILEPNRLVFSQEAIDLLKVCEDCRIDIKYHPNDDKQVLPIIGTDSAFGTKGGNLLRKNNTVSYGGAANSKLQQFGTKFTLTPTKEEGLFWLSGDAPVAAPEVPEEVVDIETELDAVNIDKFEDADLTKFDFKL